MQDEQFDDLIRQKLKQDEDPVGLGLWEKIATDLPKKPAGNAFFRKWPLLLLLLGGALGLIPVSLWLNGDDASNHQVSEKHHTMTSATPAQNTNSALNTSRKTANKANDDRKPSSFEQKGLMPSAPEALSLTTQSAAPVKQPNRNEPSVPAAVEDDIIRQSQVVSWPEEQTIMPAIPLTAQLAEDSRQSDLIPSAAAIKMSRVAFKKFFVDLYYAPEITQHARDLGSGDENYLRLRRSTESSVYSHSQGLRLGYWLNHRVAVKTGVDLYDIQERLSYTYIPGMGNMPVGMKIDSVEGYFVDPFTNALVADTIVGNPDYAGEVNLFNHYRFINIPFMLSWTFNSGLWSFSPGIGTYMNIGTRYRGTIIHTDRKALIDLSSEQSPYRKTIGFGLSLEALMSYHYNQTVELVVGPKFNYHLSNINKPDAPVKERISNTGVYTGIRISF
jgi:hypothetical protein